MSNLKDRLKITGKYRVIIKRTNGKIEQGEWLNTINDELKAKVNDQFLASSDFALDTLFVAVATPPATGKDGIVIKDSDNHWYSMISTTGSTDYTTTVTGVITGLAKTFTDIAMGFNHAGTDSDSFGTNYADPTSFNSITLAAADQLTIEWTITVS